MNNHLKPCDLVMKGGVASGIIYPPTILELSNTYYFKQIGGTSVGAITAVATAAAEYGRHKGNKEIFSGKFKEFTIDYLKENYQKVTNLISLFQPSPENQKLFKVLLGYLDENNKFKFIVKNIFSLISLLFQTKFYYRQLKQNYWGLCTGMNGVTPVKNDQRKALTEWLHEIIQECSGLTEKEPLTFKHLEECPEIEKITLKMVTTNLSINQPYVLPFQNRYFLFREEDFRQKFFPADVIDYMIEISNKYQADKHLNLPKIETIDKYHFLPIGKDMPVLVAARMSMSFPILFSMIPLYSIKASSKNKTIINQEDLLLNLFSDGGIASNFPIHFFDALVPGYPTFGIDLISQEKKDKINFNYIPTNIDNEYYIQPPIDLAKEEQRVYLPKPEEIPCSAWYDLDNLFKIALKGIFSTSQNYRDTMQSKLPSYRERIAQVYLSENEGGLKLRMSSEEIEKLQRIGTNVGKELKKFDSIFKHHQWVRIKIMMALLEQGLKQLDKTQKNYKLNYQELLKEQKESQFAYSEQDDNWCDDSQERINALIELVEKIKNLDDSDQENQKGFSVKKPLVDEKQILLRVTPEL